MLDLIRSQWPPPQDGSVYFNFGSCGRKPKNVIWAVDDGWRELNQNPTRVTFLDPAPMDAARNALAELTGLPAADILLTHNSTQSLHLAMNSFLLKEGDELITTNHEHGSVLAIGRLLAETRGVIVRKVHSDPLAGEQKLLEGVNSLLNKNTKLVLLSEIDCFSGWRPDLSKIAEMLDEFSIPLLIDGAHSLGQGPTRSFKNALYSSSCHKWLAGPNGTGILYAPPELAQRLKPVWIGDRFFEKHEHPLRRFEFQGTEDVVRWWGVEAACKLQQELNLEQIALRQRELVMLLAERLRNVAGARIRSPLAEGETSGILTVTWERARVLVPHLRDYLWERHQIWTQPDFCYGDPAHGLRLSCHVTIFPSDIDRLITALRSMISLNA